ncbi:MULTISPECIES: hypothetical protein [Microbacterium]|jgi:hypothetical protein|uniref:hypothetical protein n=1 Tax=Microbacterium TaxID=33882 RepID=UPI001D170996|nr:hypothetical protein [Microbacterium schleiferi]MCC4266941.1 hypothetical protein [Microbacterium schleiferi]
MTIEWEGADLDRAAASAAAEERARLLERRVGEPLQIANEFSEITVSRVETRNGTRLLIDSSKTGQWIALDPLELEALTWQTVRTFSEMIGTPDAPLFPDSPDQ